MLNAIRWQLADGSRPPDPAHVQKHPVFEGRAVPVVTKAMFRTTGFTAVAPAGRSTSTAGRPPRCSSSTCGRLVAEGAPFVYAYYPGVDEVAHAYGLARRRTTRPSSPPPTDSSARCSTRCRPTPRSLVTADHGQVQVGPDGWLGLQPLHPMVETYAGDGRFRYLHARPGAARRPVRGRARAPRRGRVGVPARAAARRGLARARPGVGHVPARRRRRARGAHRRRLRRSDAALRGAARLRPRIAHPGRDAGAARRRPRTSTSRPRANVGELHPCDSSTGPVEGLVDEGEDLREQRWPSRSCTCTCTPSSRCSTVRPASPRWSRRRRPTASPRSASPTTGTCTASSTSTARRARPTSRR